MFGDGKVTWLDQISVKVVKIFIRSNRNPSWKMAMQRETIIFSCMSRTRSFPYCVNTFDHKNKPLIDDHLNLEKLPRTKKIEFFTSYLQNLHAKLHAKFYCWLISKNVIFCLERFLMLRFFFVTHFRVLAGHCFHLFTNYHNEQLVEYQLPEMLRTPLESLCLQIKVLVGVLRIILGYWQMFGMIINCSFCI